MDILRENHKKFLKNNKLILKSQQKCRSEKHNVFTEEVNKIALTVYSDKKNAISCFNRNICIWSKYVKQKKPNATI